MSDTPSESMSQQDFTSVFCEICNEYGVSNTLGNRVSIVEHVKPRASGVGNDKHWHLAFPEFDTETSRTLSSRFYKIRNEKISRICELIMRHEIVPGRFNKQVYEAIQKERPQLDLAPFEATLRRASIQSDMAEADWLKYRARNAASNCSNSFASDRLGAAKPPLQLTSFPKEIGQ